LQQRQEPGVRELTLVNGYKPIESQR